MIHQGRISISLFIIGLSILYLQDICISAQEIPTLNDVQIISKIDFDKNVKTYKYSYELTNPQKNTGQISRVEVDISKPEGGQDVSAEGLVIYAGVSRKGKTLTTTFEDAVREYGWRLEKTLVPIGMQVPSGWSGGISVMGTASWGSHEKKYRIMPGQSLSGFIIISKGLPTIRDMSLHPKWILVTEGYVTEEDIEKSKKTKEEITWKGKTIGPTAPPADFKPIYFLDNIISMKHEATSLGWIKDKGIEQSLDAKLDNAKKKIEQGNNSAAKNILEAFINEVEAQNGKHLTSEAYGLLKYNVQYLMEKL